MGTMINIIPDRIRIPIAVPKRNCVDAIPMLDLDERMKYIYSGLFIADTIDGYILELINDTKRCNLYRHGFKRSLNEMKRCIERYKSIMYNSVCITELANREFTNNLDIMDDEFGCDMKILFYSIKKYVQHFIVNSDHATCIARVQVINILSGYSMMNDEKMSRIMSKVMMRNICLQDPNIKAINFETKKYTVCFASIHADVDIDLNKCNEIFTAFTIIDKKMNTIHELLKNKQYETSLQN